ncbi:wiskott-Aldrich syndrome protein family member 2-like [Populus alba x Populus x berolinensis]|nr:wiskott-Aldrich syndrome protein family member 2-like [Populus alba x Populus x berolinensis]
MDINLTLTLSVLFFTSVLANLPSLATSDDVCPYPCYPPPTGTGTPTVIRPPSPPSQSAGSYSPPGYPSPTGNLPFYPPPPFGNNLYGLPPPDPILPYFPFYYRKPPHQTDASLATNSLPTLMVAASNILAFAFLHLVFGC